MDNSAITEAYKGLAGARADITRQTESNDRARQEWEKRRREDSNRHHQNIHQSQIEAASQRKEQLSSLDDVAKGLRQDRNVAQQSDAEKLSKLETYGKTHRVELKAEQQTRIDDIKERAAAQAAEQKELLDEEIHGQKQGMAAQNNAHQQGMEEIRNAFNRQRLKQDEYLEAKQIEAKEKKDLYSAEERHKKKLLDAEKKQLDQRKLRAQKEQIEMQLKYLKYLKTMCKTVDSYRQYADNIVPSVKYAKECRGTIETLIEYAHDLVDQCEADFASDYKKVSDEICDFTMFVCDQALRDLDIGRHSISSRAVDSLKMLSHGLTKENREDFLKALYSLEKAENDLRKLCEQMKSNVKYQSNFNKLKELIDVIEDEAMDTLNEKIVAIPTEENVDKANDKIEELTDKLDMIEANIGKAIETDQLDASNAYRFLKQ